MSPRLALVCAAILMAAAVALGAFGAHALKARLAADALVVWQTAVNYHAWHALGLLGVGVLMTQFPHSRGLARTAWLFVTGIALFCGSLYALALGEGMLPLTVLRRTEKLVLQIVPREAIQ